MLDIKHIAATVMMAAALNGCAVLAAHDPQANINANANENANKPVSTGENRAVQPSLDNILATLRDQSTPEQYQIFADAIHASPKLSAQLNTLIDAGLLAQLRVGQPGEDTWGAWRKGGEWVFMPDFIASQSPHLLVHIVLEGGILPNNMAFALGFMAWHAQHDNALTKKIRPLIASGTKEQIDRAAALELQADACAFIQGWNDVVDVAAHQNHGTPPTPAPIVSLMMNLLYREPILKAIKMPGFHFDQNSVNIPLDKQNIDALTEAVGQSRLSNIKPYMMQ